jgi:hypothetical protein
MTMIGSISAKITADGSGFTKASNQAQKDAGKTDKAIGSNLVALAKWAAGAAAVYKAIKRVSDQYSILDNLAKTSDALGIQQERFQALRHVADLTGVGAENLTGRMQRLQNSIGQAARSGGAAEQSLKALGLSARDLVNLPMDKQMEAVARGMANVGTHAERASVAQDLFGRDSARMLKMLDELKVGGLDPVVAELDAMGVMLTRVDTAKIEAANDAITRAGVANNAIFQQLAVKFAPIVEGVSKLIVELSKDSNRLGEIVDSVFNHAITVAGVFANGIHGIRVIVKGLESAFQGFAWAVNTIFAKIASGIETLVNTAIKNINTMIFALNTIKPGALGFITGIEGNVSGFFEDAADSWSGALRQTNKELKSLMGEDLPSVAIERWVAKVVAESDKAAQAVADAAAGNIGGGGAVQGLSPEEEKALQARLEALRKAGMSEVQLKQETYMLDQEALITALENELITREEYNLLAQEAAMRHQQALTDIDQQAADQRAAIAEMERRSRFEGMQTMFSNLAQLMNTGSRKLFEIGKMAAIAGAVQNAYESISNSYKHGTRIGGPPVGAAFAAAAGAASFAQVKAIKSQSFSSGAGAGMNFQGGQPSMPTGGQVGPQQPARNVSISLTGDNFGAGGIRGLIREIGEQLGDGFNFSVTGG